MRDGKWLVEPGERPEIRAISEPPCKHRANTTEVQGKTR
jgi:hypothetical protein